MKIRLLALAGLTGVAASGGLGALAYADPVNPSGPRVLAGAGSDTTQAVLGALADVVVGSDGSKLIASYDATGGGTITTKSAAGCTFARPNGSGAGRAALLKALNPSDPTFGCLDFARSSSLNLAPTDVGLTYVPFAVDAVSYAVSGNTSLPRDLSKARLAAIYRCEDPAVPAPLLPQASSGTRAFWLAQLGLTETTKGACVVDSKNGSPIEENTGTFVTGATDIIPFSVASYVAQANGTATDTRGTAVLGSVDGVSPTTGSGSGLVLNSAFGIKRSVYNVIPTAKIGTAPWKDAFVGSGSKVCAQSAVIQRLGFGLSTECGSTTNQTATSGTATPTPTTPAATPTATTPAPKPTAGTAPALAGVSPQIVTPGVPVSVRVTGQAGQQVELVAYSRPSTTFKAARTATLDASGAATFTLAPGTNTKLYVRVAGDDSSRSAYATVSVKTAISLSYRRLGTHSYVFEGRLLPRRAGQLITLYRVVGGREVQTSQVRSDSTGTWRIPRTFTGNGRFQFVARTGQTLTNIAGVTNVRTVAVR